MPMALRSMLPSLPAAALYRACDESLLEFDSTAGLRAATGPVGHRRATDAIEFVLDVRQPRHNLFVMGEPGSGRHTHVRQLVEAKAGRQGRPPDWCYINNFAAGQAACASAAARPRRYFA